MNSQIIQKKTDEFISNFTPDELAKYATVLLSRTRKSRIRGELTGEQADRIISQFVDKHLTGMTYDKHFKYLNSLRTLSVHEMEHELLSVYYHDQKILIDSLQLAVQMVETLLVEATVSKLKSPDDELEKACPGWLEKTAHVTGLLINRLNSSKKNLEDLLASEEWELTNVIPQEAKTMQTPDEVLKRMKNPDYKDPALEPYVPVIGIGLTGINQDADYQNLWHQLYDRMKEDISGDDSVDEPVLEEK